MRISRRVLASLPASWRFTVLSLWEMTKSTHKIYSQNGEELVLKHIFRSQNNGFFVDIGAHHPKRFSNTYSLYKSGWTGINIDANPTSITFFNIFRKKDTNLCLGVGTAAGHLAFYRFADPAVNTFSPEEAERLKQKKWNTFLGTQLVPTQPINSILENHLPPNQSIDLLNIDVEGLDYDILKSLNWDTYAPKAIIVEDHDFSPQNPTQSPTYQLLTSHNYYLRTALNYSLIFVRAT